MKIGSNKLIHHYKKTIQLYISILQTGAYLGRDRWGKCHIQSYIYFLLVLLKIQEVKWFNLEALWL